MSRTIVVTGGAKGIGRAITERFAALGDEVIAFGRDELALDALAPGSPNVRAVVCDVTSERAVDEAFGQLGAVDVLVNNAGIAESAPLAKTTLDSWLRHFDVNVTGPFLCMRAVVPGMRERGCGAIVTVASTAGRVGTPYTSAYTSSKHATVGLVRAVASELGGTGVRVNAVCPTFVRTELTARALARIVEDRALRRAGRARAGQPVPAGAAARARRGRRRRRVPGVRRRGLDQRSGAGARRRRDSGLEPLGRPNRGGRPWSWKRVTEAIRPSRIPITKIPFPGQPSAC